MQTLFIPKENHNSVDREREKSGDIDENFPKKENLEIPAVFLFPCSRKSSIPAEQNLEGGNSSEFLFSTPILDVSNGISCSLPDGKKQEPLSLSSTSSPENDVSFKGSPSKRERASRCYTSDNQHGNENFCVHNGVGQRLSSDYGELLTVGTFEYLTDTLIGPSVSTGALSTAELNTTTTRQQAISVTSTQNLHQSVSPCCLRSPSSKLCCLLGASYTALSTPTSECYSSRFSREQSFEDNGCNEHGRPFQKELLCSEDTDGRGFPILVCKSAVTKSSDLVVDEQPAFNSPTQKNGSQHYSTPDLRLKRAHTLPSDWEKPHFPQYSVADGKSNPNLQTTGSSMFLHPDIARVSSASEGSAASSSRSLSSQTSTYRKRNCHGAKRPRLRRQQISIHSSGSSAFGASSDKSEKSTLKSFLSLLSPSKLLAKLSSPRQSVGSADDRTHRRKRENIAYPDDDILVTLNVSGRRFQIQDYFLSIHPSTLLGGRARSLFYDRAKNEFFFDRDPDCFRYIWDFYHSGKLHCPREECVQLFLDEITFFGLDVSMLCNCCWHETFEVAYERLTKRRDEKRAADKEAAGEIHALSPGASLREKIWKTLEEPSYSFVAKMFYLVSVFVIAVSVVANTTETIACKGALRICQEENQQTYFYIDSCCVGFFTIEYLLRFIFCPSRLRFVIHYMSIVDVLAILPYYIDLLLEYLAVGVSSGMDALVVLRVLRILRVFKLLRHSKRLKKLTQTVRDSATELGLISFVYLVLVILFSSIIYFAELSDESQFTSIPQAMWYAVITSTTAGYGDIIPVTLAGRLVGSACCLFGVLVIALPVPILQIK
ncbi:uncharacterized protein [Montipora foliosa]|uniref:uncharacterized protein n=1 Tax=Montipora foliosa TaxID=591990 RepID=UPI0035F129EC